MKKLIFLFLIILGCANPDPCVNTDYELTQYRAIPKYGNWYLQFYDGKRWRYVPNKFGYVSGRYINKGDCLRNIRGFKRFNVYWDNSYDFKYFITKYPDIEMYLETLRKKRIKYLDDKKEKRNREIQCLTNTK